MRHHSCGVPRFGVLAPARILRPGRGLTLWLGGGLSAVRIVAGIVAGWLTCLLPNLVVGAEPMVQRFGKEAATGGASAVVVSGADLIHLTQILPSGADGKLVGPGDIDAQIIQVAQNLIAAIELAGGDASRVLKLNVYVTEPRVVEAVRQRFADAGETAQRPAISFVVTTLPDPAALLAVDAVIAGGEGVRRGQDDGLAAAPVKRFGEAGRLGGRIGPVAAVLPSGPRVYISGQAEAGDGTVADASRQTLASLGRSLDFLGLKRADVVQVKAFLTPMTAVGDFENEVSAFFAGEQLPVMAVVEWRSDLPIEIEMIVAGQGTLPVAEQAAAIDFLTPPGMTASPIYCRIARVLAPSSIYTTGIYAASPDLSGEQEVADVLQQLNAILEQTGGDWRHLAKATYYVSSDATSTELNRQRPQHYDPRRPPAASKAVVAGSGRDGRQITIDLIGTRP